VLQRLRLRFESALDGSPDQELEARRFLTRVLLVLLAYDSLFSDPGQHGMLPVALFDVLRRWGAEGEGFATPLNATLPRFCSLHGACDRFFGSEGPFFDWRPAEGNFELNPPFVIQGAVVEDRVVELLEDAERRGAALSFVYVIPETVSRQRTRDAISRRTRFLARATFAAKDEHVYRMGLDFRKHAQVPWDCPLTTAITWFQTSAARRKWPVTDDLVRDVLRAFKSTGA
jgi:hypothetical protein